jgi:PAS domain S-box-containing protein
MPSSASGVPEHGTPAASGSPDLQGALEDAQSRFRDLFEMNLAGIYLTTASGEILDCNPALARIFGYERDELRRLRAQELYFDVEARDGNLRRLRAEGEVVSGEVMMRRRDGKPVWVLFCERLRGAADGREVISGTLIDITARKEAEEALRLSEHRLQSLVSEVPVVLFVLDRDGIFTLSEGRGLAVLGLRPGEVVGRSALELYRDFPQVVAHLRRALAGETTRATLEVGPVTFDTAFTPLRDGDGAISGLVGVALDVTERRLAEEDLRRNQRLESIGTLAGGLAHDFNNLLTAVLANVSMAREAGSDAERRELLGDAELASRRARDLTRQLLTFSRGGAPVRKMLSLENTLRETLGFALAGTPVSGEAVVEADLWPVEADEGQLVQVLNNLLLNAAQAMPGGGRVVVRASNRPAAGDEGPRVQIAVEDDGAGIPADLLPRVFDPYFTTREKGHGLGLAVVHSIVRAHGGRVSVDSRPGLGSTFTVELPASPGGVAAGPPLPVEATRGRGRILVMDDEPLVRKSAERALEVLGYEVVATHDGAEAVARFRAERAAGRGFDAVILDLTVPGGMGGEEAMRSLLELDPGVKAIVSSGYSRGPGLANHRAHGFAAVLEKPWRIEELGATLQRVLSG